MLTDNNKHTDEEGARKAIEDVQLSKAALKHVCLEPVHELLVSLDVKLLQHERLSRAKTGQGQEAHA